MKIAVMGAGGVGGYFGGRLSAHGENVTFIARGEHLRAIQAHGLRVQSHHGDFHLRPAVATDDPSQVGPVDIVMFCVKTWDTESAGRAARPLLGEQTAVISFQNGVENEEILAEILGPEHVMGGLAYVTSIIAAPGLVQQAGPVARLIFGEIDGQPSARARAFHRLCREADIDVGLSTDIRKDMWTKFLYICAFSGVSTLTRQPLGPVLNDPDTRELFVGCMREVEAAARARGIQLEPDVVTRQLALADAYGPDLKPSMLSDLERGNRLELEWLNGSVARMGRDLGIETPLNQFIWAALKHHARGSGP